MDDEYRIITLNNTTIKCFRSGMIHTISKCRNKGTWIERTSLPNKRGYIQLKIGGKRYLAHRLIMMAFVGYSDQEIDHINRIKHDNRVRNLRYCTRRENTLNRDWVDNAKGFYWNKRDKKWKAYIRIHNKNIHLGYFEKEEDARQAYLQAKANRDNI